MKVNQESLVPAYVEAISKSANPVFRTCEVLTRVDNLLAECGLRSLPYGEKIKILRELKKRLTSKMTIRYQISPKQDDPNKNVLELIDGRIDQYRVKSAAMPAPPRIFDRKGSVVR